MRSESSAREARRAEGQMDGGLGWREEGRRVVGVVVGQFEVMWSMSEDVAAGFGGWVGGDVRDREGIVEDDD